MRGIVAAEVDDDLFDHETWVERTDGEVMEVTGRDGQFGDRLDDAGGGDGVHLVGVLLDVAAVVVDFNGLAIVELKRIAMAFLAQEGQGAVGDDVHLDARSLEAFGTEGIVERSAFAGCIVRQQGNARKGAAQGGQNGPRAVGTGTRLEVMFGLHAHLSVVGLEDVVRGFGLGCLVGIDTDDLRAYLHIGLLP